MKIPKALENVIESFEALPGIGPKSAQRLGFYLLHVPQSDLDGFAQALTNLKKNTRMCSICFNIGTTELCDVCVDPERDTATVCVVEDALDVIAFERSDKFKGVYHVLHGVVDPLNSIGPEDIYIPQLIKRVQGSVGSEQIKEIIIATNPTMEGEATAMYIVKQLKNQNSKVNSDSMGVKITRIGRGLPVGADIEYADEVTLTRALEGRSEY
ncbi:MAG: recombination mediator RecR [Candidatus Levybacteria bacterium]|nr:recombination mediator RecR [Candidatus Levybacteria bacterium]